MLIKRYVDHIKSSFVWMKAKLPYLSKSFWNFLLLISTDWIKNPTMIIVETTDYPIEKIPFPTVTVCQKDNDPNKLLFVEKFLNHVRFPCYEDYK